MKINTMSKDCWKQLHGIANPRWQICRGGIFSQYLSSYKAAEIYSEWLLFQIAITWLCFSSSKTYTSKVEWIFFCKTSHERLQILQKMRTRAGLFLVFFWLICNMVCYVHFTMTALKSYTSRHFQVLEKQIYNNVIKPWVCENFSRWSLQWEL